MIFISYDQSHLQYMKIHQNHMNNGDVLSLTKAMIYHESIISNELIQIFKYNLLLTSMHYVIDFVKPAHDVTPLNCIKHFRFLQIFTKNLVSDFPFIK